MSYNQYESSGDEGSPITLYFCRVGDDTEGLIGFTDHDEPVFHQVVLQPGNVLREVRFEPIATERDDVESNGTGERSAMTFNTSLKNPLVPLFKDGPPAAVVAIHVLEGHADDPDREMVRIWTGRVLTMNYTGGAEVEFECQPSATSLARPALTRNWQHQCPLPLYSTGVGRCNAKKEPMTLSAAGVEGNYLRLIAPSGVPSGVEAYAGGTVDLFYPGIKYRDLRTIIEMVDIRGGMVAIRLQGRIPAVTEATILKGCPHTEEACIKFHNNILNYGGQVFIPEDNPVGKLTTY